MKTIRIICLSLALIISVGSCSQTPSPTATAPATLTISVDGEKWREDLHYLAEALVRQHMEPFRTTPEDQFQAAVADLDERIPTLTDEQIVFGMMRIVAMLRDGHTILSPLQEELSLHMYPLRLYWFSDGLYVIDALAPYQNSIGKRMTQAGKFTIDEAYKLIEPTISADNEMSALAIAPIRFVLAEELLALGIISDINAPEFLLEDETGEHVTLNPKPIAVNEYREWVYPERRPSLAAVFDEITFFSGLPQQEQPLYLSHRSDRYFWLEYLEDSETLYIQYNFVLRSSTGQTIKEFSQEVAEIARERKPERIMVDLRHNPGGEMPTSSVLEAVLRDTAEINQPKKLFVLIGRDTFSAAGWFALLLNQGTNAVFVGEPMGSGRVMGGGPRMVRLPNSHVEVYISTEWNLVDPDPIAPPTLDPDHVVRLSGADYFAGRDPVLDFVLSYP